MQGMFKFLLVGLFVSAGSAVCAQEVALPQSGWQLISEQERSAVFAFAEDYKDFMSRAKTELSFVSEAVRLAQNAGFKPMPASGSLPAGGRYYDVNRGRTVTLFVVGTEPMVDGFRVVGAHVDSPRLEPKGRPLYEAEGFALFQTYQH
ncbi:MAG: aminopeptidase 1, partial [Congregibacter sp.]|nr:aminopeptidase 1 [Congregibacter sp.]